MFRKLPVAFIVIAFTLPLAAREKTRHDRISNLLLLIDQADEMVVYGEGFKREFVVYRSSKRKDFEELKSSITLKRAGGPFVCACVDGPEIALLRHKKEMPRFGTTKEPRLAVPSGKAIGRTAIQTAGCVGLTLAA